MKIIWIDLETGGLSEKRCDTTQIAAILDVDGKVVEEINLLLRPDPKRVEAGALAVQKKTLEQVLAHPLSQKEGYEAFKAALARWTADGKASFGGQNCPFDAGFCKELFAANGDVGGLARYFTGSTVDTMDITNDLRSRGKWMIRNAKLGTITEALGVKFGDGGAHDALNDVRATRESFYLIKARFLAAA